MTSALNWEIDQKVVDSYAKACIDATSEESFLNFKKDSRYRHILEGGTKLTFDYFLDKLKIFLIKIHFLIILKILGKMIYMVIKIFMKMMKLVNFLSQL